MKMILFEDLLEKNSNRYIGYGNPNSPICFVGKEASGNCRMSECVLGDAAMWKCIMPMFDQILAGTKIYQDAAMWKCIMPMFFNREKGSGDEAIWKPGHTWMKYQKLFNEIDPSKNPGKGRMNFEQHVFLTEMSELVAT